MFRWQAVGKFEEVLAQEKSGFKGHVLIGRAEVERVVVPVEKRLLLFFQEGEQLFLHLVQDVEAHKGVAVHVGVERDTLLLQVLHHTAEKCPLVGQTFGRQFGIEMLIEGQEVVPDLEEVLADFAFLMGVKVGKESAQHLFLFVGQEGIGVFQGLEVAEVLKQGFGIGHVLVEVVEVRQNALGPSVENVERWRPLHSLGVASVETAHRVDGVIDRKSRKAVEEVADG